MAPHLHHLLRTRLGRDPRPEEVSLAESLAEGRNPERAATEAARLLRGLEAGLEAQEAPRGRSEGPERTVPGDHRHEALARILAADAAQAPEVQAFRREALRGRLLKPERVAAWLERQAKREGRPTVWARVPLDAEGRLPRKVPAGTRAEVESLDSPTADGRVTSRAIAAGGTLARLKGLAGRLGREYGWREAYAVAFVVSGLVPPYPSARWRLRPRLDIPALARIELDVSPRLPPARVAELYRRAREAGPGGPDALGLRGQRLRSVGEEAAELAVFVHRINDGRSWEEALKAWNAAHPEWRKPSVPAFCRAAREAFERVVGARLEWARRRGEREPVRRQGRRRRRK